MATQKILIIDDDVEFCEELTELLRNEGYSVRYVCVTTAVEAVNSITVEDQDIVILDYKMHGLTAVDVLRKTKADAIKKNIIIISGRPFVEKILEEEGLANQVCCIMSKPIDIDELLAACQHLSPIH